MKGLTKYVALVLAMLALSGGEALGIISEPDKIFFGTITVSNRAVAASDGYRTNDVSRYSVEVRLSPAGPAIASYQMGANTNYHPYFYGVRVPLEAYAELVAAEVKIADVLYLVLKSGETVVSQKVHQVFQRGLSREDFGPRADSDGDGLADLDEFDVHHTDPANSDTDGDGLTDGPEVLTYGTDPLDPDTDADDDMDGLELAYRTDPLDPAHFLASVSGVVTYAGAQTGAIQVAVCAAADSNQVLKLDGFADYAAVDGLYYDTPGQVTALTAMAWVKTTSVWCNVVLSWDRSAAWRLSVGSERLGGFAGEVGFDTTDQVGESHDMRGRFRVNDGRWHHIAATYDSATGKKAVYVDGVLDEISTNAHAAGAGLVGGPEIGVRYGFIGVGSDAATFNGQIVPSYYFDGSIDEVRIWNRAMAGAEIRSNMYGALLGDEPALQAWFNFDNGTPADASTNAFGALLVSDAAIAWDKVGECQTTWIPQAGAYTVTLVRTLSDYWVTGYMDSRANTTQDYWEASGSDLAGPIFLADDMDGVDFALTDPDHDGDGLFDYQELFIYNTDPFDTDTDNDNLSDYDEVMLHNSNPRRADTDRDGLRDDLEVANLTNPRNRDTDGDHYSDSWEVREGTSPINPLDFPLPAPFNDYNGDGVSDLAVFHLSAANWYIRSLGPGNPIAFGQNWGLPDYVTVPGDYNGDGLFDLAVYDPVSGDWFIRSLGPVGPAFPAIAFGVNWGGAGLVPVSGDYNGDNIYDLAVYDPASGNWFIRSLNSATPIAFGQNWGGASMVPVPGDYNGDGLFDLAVYQQSSGSWFIRSLGPGAPLTFGQVWGGATSRPVSGDYDGNGRFDMAVYEESTGTWLIRSLGGAGTITPAGGQVWGGAGLLPVPGDYDGDGVYDLGVHDPVGGLWYIRPVTGGAPITFGQNWGGAGLEPVGMVK